ncbi:efflux RND transporter permease subunit [Mariniblastus fucicola]|uniref:Bifunctional preprotein translocase subunit SecD/SecF n=1 Tax=Mariniblastus fucicola TaxID=980251 RepID=A0A5B9PGE2_9BACT|nr:MMPL family transporter [Mariniblastus fucicola]QEG23832.1 bifunctional preprotein translocase subunit SecD/SecF [Mariniblastus fucicola]
MEENGGLSRWIAGVIVQRRVLVLVVLFLTLLFAIPWASKITFDFSPEMLLAGDEASVAARSDDTFGGETRFIVIALAATGEDDVFLPEALSWQYDVTRALLKEPRILKAKGLATIRLPNKISFFDGKQYKWLFETRNHTDESAAKLRKTVAEVEQFKGRVISEDMRLTAIAAFLHEDDEKIDEIAEVVEIIEAILREHPCPSGFETHLSGLPFVRVSIIDLLKTDLTYLIPIAAVFFGIVLIFLFRCSAAIALPGVALGIGLAWTIGALAWAEEPINVITNVMPIILLVIGVSNCVHILSRYAEEHARSDDRGVALKRTMAHMIPSCLLTTLTTALGFLSLLFTSSYVLRGFGWQSAMGLALIYVALIAVFGALGIWFRAPAMYQNEGAAIENRFAERVCVFSAQRPWIAVVVSLLAASVAIAAAVGFPGFSGVELNSFLVETIDKDSPAVRSMSLIEEKLGGFIQAEVILETDNPELLTTPDLFNRVRRITEQFEGHEEISHVTSWATIFELADAFVPGEKAFFTEADVADDTNTLQRLDRIRYGLQKKRGSSDLKLYLTRDESAGRILLSLTDLGSRRGRELMAELEAALAREFPPDVGVRTRLTGEGYHDLHALDGFVSELFVSLVIASLAIFVVLACFFRSVKFGLISILPNVTPLLFTLGYMGLRGYDLNAANVTVFAIGLGIAVDDTIHFLARFHGEYSLDGQLMTAIKRTARGSGRAIVLTTVLIVCGMLLILLNSSFVPTKRFAELTIVTMMAALLGDLVLLPAIIKIVYRDRQA